jgi:hypothetical protein
MTRSAPVLESPRFDWMQATVHDEPEQVIALLSDTLGGQSTPGRGLNGYHASHFVKRDEETLARVLHGGPNGYPHIIATGAPSDEVVPVIRTAWSGMHEVTRMDSAQDFDDDGGYDRLTAVLLDVAGRYGLTTDYRESVVNGQRSRTLYIGAPSSRVRLRLYEKGCFEHQLGNAAASLDWCRLEAQIRPTGVGARRNAAELDAIEAWGMSKWLRDIAEQAMELDVERVVMQIKREPDYARALRALERQYGGILARALEVEGSWESVGRLIGVIK